MSSALQTALIGLLQNNYATLAAATAVGYDYVLTFSDEVEYIWTKPWTSVSILFMLVRYAGLYYIAINVLDGTTFLPGPEKSVCQSFGRFQGLVTSAIQLWAFFFFLVAADFVMILRVWAMYSRSRFILCILLALYSLEMIVSFVDAVVYNDAGSRSVIITQIFDSGSCNWTPTFPVLTTSANILQIVNGAAVCILAVAQFAKQSLQMHRISKGWEINRYMKLLVTEGIFYYIGIFLYCFLNVLNTAGVLEAGWQVALVSVVGFVPMITLTPRFILGMRELYARGVQGRWGSGIDTGFGLLSASGRGAAGADMVFAGAEQSEEMEGIEEVLREGATTQFGP